MSILEMGSVFDGRYRIESLIGSGGMADVYLVTEIETKKPLALKVLKEEFSDNAEFVRRFISEAKAMMALSHEGIVRSIDVGEFCDCQYIALEYIEGDTLKKEIQKGGPFNREKAISITVQLCDALSHAHDRHIVHRDIKPQNIIMSKAKPILTDFGIARFIDSRTQTYMGTQVLGSVHYLSPEQAKGEEVNEQSDIYSLGIVLYEMVTGKPPFDSENTVSIALKHIQEKIQSPIERNPKIGLALNDVILKATNKECSERYQNMREMKQDLLWALKNSNKHLKSVKEQEKARRKSRKRVMMIIVSAGICLVVIVLFFIWASMEDGKRIYAPNFIGKTIEQAEQEAQGLGLTIKEGSNATNENASLGAIVEQSPQAGKRVSKDNEITVNVNVSDEWIVMPDFSQKTEQEADKLAQELDLDVEWNYAQDSAIEGTVFRQSPQSTIEIERGDSIELWVSGERTTRLTVPSMIDIGYEEAIQKLTNEGFETVWVQYLSGIDESLAESIVVRQSPIAGELILPTDRIDLSVQRNHSFAYSAEIALNVDIDQQDSRVIVAKKENGVLTILSEKVMAPGLQQAMPVTVYADSEGEVEVVLYVNDKPVRSKLVKVSAK